MTDATISTMVVALLASAPPTILALATLITGLRNAKKADTLVEKTTEIHALTNSQLAAVTAALAVANTKIEGLVALASSVAEAKQAAAAAAEKKDAQVDKLIAQKPTKK